MKKTSRKIEENFNSTDILNRKIDWIDNYSFSSKKSYKISLPTIRYWYSNYYCKKNNIKVDEEKIDKAFKITEELNYIGIIKIDTVLRFVSIADTLVRFL